VYQRNGSWCSDKLDRNSLSAQLTTKQAPDALLLKSTGYGTFRKLVLDGTLSSRDFEIEIGYEGEGYQPIEVRSGYPLPWVLTPSRSCSDNPAVY